MKMGFEKSQGCVVCMEKERLKAGRQEAIEDKIRRFTLGQGRKSQQDAKSDWL